MWSLEGSYRGELCVLMFPGVLEQLPGCYGGVSPSVPLFPQPQPVLIGFVPVSGAAPTCDAALITDVLISPGTSRLVFGQFVVNFLMRMAPPLSVLYSATFYFSINNHPAVQFWSPEPRTGLTGSHRLIIVSESFPL